MGFSPAPTLSRIFFWLAQAERPRIAFLLKIIIIIINPSFKKVLISEEDFSILNFSLLRQHVLVILSSAEMEYMP